MAEGDDAAAPADVIVVGHRGDSRMALMLGSTANYVAHHAQRPVVIVRGQVPPDGPPARRVVVGADDHDLDDADATNESVRALQWAYELPGVETIRVVNAWFLPPVAIGLYPSLGTDLEPMDAASFEAIERVIAAAGEPPAGVTIERAALRGTYLADVTTAGAGDLVAVTGDIDLAQLVLQLVDPLALNRQQAYTILTCTGTRSGALAGTNLPQGWRASYHTPGVVKLVYASGTLIRVR